MRHPPSRLTIATTLLLGAAALSLFAAAPGQRKSPAQEYLKPPGSHATQPNLVRNGDFEKTEPAIAGALGPKPANWGDFCTDQSGTTGFAVADAGAPHGKVLQLTANVQQATTTGMFCYSDAIAVTPGRTYDITMDIQTDGIGVIVFVKGYGTANAGAFAGRERELYRHKKDALLQPGKWMPFVSYFTPAGPAGQEVRDRRGGDRPTVSNVRIEVYIYGGAAGQAQFDNVRVTERPAEESQNPASPGAEATSATAILPATAALPVAKD